MNCAPRKKIYTFEPAHTDRRSKAATRFKGESPVPKGAAKKGTNPSVPRPVTLQLVSPVLKQALLGERNERKRVRGH